MSLIFQSQNNAKTISPLSTTKHATERQTSRSTSFIVTSHAAGIEVCGLDPISQSGIMVLLFPDNHLCFRATLLTRPAASRNTVVLRPPFRGAKIWSEMTGPYPDCVMGAMPSIWEACIHQMTGAHTACAWETVDRV